jgi:hypothetical protein
MIESEHITDNLTIDLASVPIEEAVITLQPLGLQLVKALLQGGERPFLSTLLPPPLVELLLPGAGIAVPPITYGPFRSQRWQRWLEWWKRQAIFLWLKRQPILSGLFRLVKRQHLVGQPTTQSPTKIQYDDLVAKAARSQISSSEWQQQVSRRLRDAFFGRPAKNIPPLTWPLIGELAWGNLAIQHEAAEQIYRYLRLYYLFYPSFGPVPQISPRTFWALIALAQPVPPGSVVTPHQRNHYIAAHHLQQIAYTQILIEGWAGFWDQWLLWQAWHHWQLTFVPESELHTSILNLPIFKHLSNNFISLSLPDDNEANLYHLAAANWQDAAPAWLMRQHQEWQFEQGAFTYA